MFSAARGWPRTGARSGAEASAVIRALRRSTRVGCSRTGPARALYASLSSTWYAMFASKPVEHLPRWFRASSLQIGQPGRMLSMVFTRSGSSRQAPALSNDGRGHWPTRRRNASETPAKVSLPAGMFITAAEFPTAPAGSVTVPTIVARKVLAAFAFFDPRLSV